MALMIHVGSRAFHVFPYRSEVSLASIRFAESALADLQAISGWYADQGAPDVGDRFVKEIIASIEALQDHPQMGRIVPELIGGSCES